MIEVGLITATLSGVLKFVTWIQSESRGQDEKTRTALNAIHDAALETRSYQRVWKTKRDINKEIELSKTWARVAAIAAEFDTQWSKIAALKDDYWASPDDWTEREIKEAGIDLEEVIEKVEELLGIPKVNR